MLLQRLLASAGAASLRSGFAGSAAQLIRSAPRTLPTLQQRRELTCSPVCMGRQARRAPPRAHALACDSGSSLTCMCGGGCGRRWLSLPPPLPPPAAAAAACTLPATAYPLRPAAACSAAGAAPRSPRARARLTRRRPSCTVSPLACTNIAGVDAQPGSRLNGCLCLDGVSTAVCIGPRMQQPSATQPSTAGCCVAQGFLTLPLAPLPHPQARLASRLRRRCGRAAPTRWQTRGCERRWQQPRWLR